MPIKSYLVYPVRGKREALAQASGPSAPAR
jgi:hypothetical protein